jgi:hypothetical protein
MSNLPCRISPKFRAVNRTITPAYATKTLRAANAPLPPHNDCAIDFVIAALIVILLAFLIFAANAN